LQPWPECLSQSAREEHREEREAEKDKYLRRLANEALDIPKPEAEIPALPKILVYTLRLRGTEEQLRRS
jgi:hypothetical protein